MHVSRESLPLRSEHATSQAAELSARATGGEAGLEEMGDTALTRGPTELTQTEMDPSREAPVQNCPSVRLPWAHGVGMCAGEATGEVPRRLNNQGREGVTFQARCQCRSLTPQIILPPKA